MKKTKIVNLKTEKYDVDITRKKIIYHFGNPFVIGKDGDREMVVRKHRFWLKGIAYTNIQSKRRKWILNNLNMLVGKRLGCVCKTSGIGPLCHGDNYILLIKSRKDAL